LEQENQDLGKKLSKKDEETSHLNSLNQILLEQIILGVVHPRSSPRQLVNKNLLQNKQMKAPWGGCMPLYFSQGFDK